MNDADLALFARDTLIAMLKLSGPALGVALVVGLAVSMLQALTQINENTLVFIPKLLAVGATIALTGGFMIGTLVEFSRAAFDQIIVVGHS